MSVKVKDTDHGYRQMRERLRQAARGAGVTVGVHAQEGAEQHGDASAIKTDSAGRLHLAGKYISKKTAETIRAKSDKWARVTILDVAIWNEFGLGVPERSFLRAWVDENAGENKEKLRKAMAMVVRGQKTLEEALALIGLSMQGGLQKKIASGVLPANAPETVARKGSSTPLIDTGQLRQSVTFKVVPGGRPSD